jgi:hypothetical protein
MSDSESRLSCFYITQEGSTRQECVGIRTPALTGLALIAFAANSFLCRGALGQAAIDAAGFTITRLVSGAVVLLSETLSFRLVAAAVLVLGGIAFAIAYPVYVGKGKA